jgi:hypothetical protein
MSTRWRVAQNEWNLKTPPWRDAVGIEEDDEDARCLAVPGLLAWFTRPDGDDNAALAVRAVNERDELIALLREAYESREGWDSPWMDRVQAVLARTTG